MKKNIDMFNVLKTAREDMNLSPEDMNKIVKIILGENINIEEIEKGNEILSQKVCEFLLEAYGEIAVTEECYEEIE